MTVRKKNITIPLKQLIIDHQVFVFEDQDFEKTLDLIDNSTAYALTGGMLVFFPPLVHFYFAEI